MMSSDFFPDFETPILEDGSYFSLPDQLGGGGGGITFGIGDANFNVQIPSIGGTSTPDVREILTQIANSHEAALKQNLGAWQSGGIGKDAAIAKAWEILNSMTAQMLRYGTQGRISAAERDRRIDPSLLRWDYVAYYIEPINGGSVTLQPLPSNVGTSNPLYNAGIGSPFGTGISTQTMMLILVAVIAIWKLK